MGSACPSLCKLRSFGRLACAVLLLHSTAQVFASEGFHRDTITIDGAPLELQLELSQAPKDFEYSGKKARNLSRRGPTVLVGMGSGFSRHSNSTLGPHVSRFIGKPTRPAATIRAGLEWGTERRFVRSDAAITFSNNWSYDALFLNDSVYKVQADGQGGMEQLIRFTYPDLGVEFDTLSLPTSLHAVQSLSIGLVFGGSIGKSPAGRKSPSRWWLGVSGSRTQSKRQGSEVNRVVNSMLPSPSNVLAEARNDWESTELWSLGIRWGASVPMGRQGWEGTVNGSWFGGLAPRLGISCGVQKRWVNKR
jgi:hypothetical protein